MLRAEQEQNSRLQEVNKGLHEKVAPLKTMETQLVKKDAKIAKRKAALCAEKERSKDLRSENKRLRTQFTEDAEKARLLENLK